VKIDGMLGGSFDEIETVNGTGNSIYSGTVDVDSTLTDSTYSLVDPSHGNNRTCDLNNGTSTCTTFTDADNVDARLLPGMRASVLIDAGKVAIEVEEVFPLSRTAEAHERLESGRTRGKVVVRIA